MVVAFSPDCCSKISEQTILSRNGLPDLAGSSKLPVSPSPGKREFRLTALIPGT